MSRISAAEHAATHLVKHDKRGVREDRVHLLGEHNQSCQSAWRIESRKMLSAENGRFPSNRSITRSINPLFAIWTDAQVSDELQTLRDANQVLLGWRFTQIAQPCEWHTISVVADRDHRLQFKDGSPFQSRDDILVGLLSGACASRQADAFLNCRRRQQNATGSQSLDHGFNDSVTTIRANRPGRRNLRDIAIIIAAERSNTQIWLYVAQMFPDGGRRAVVGGSMLNR